MTKEAAEFKEGDKVDFDHLGEAKTGTVLAPAGDGKVRIKDSRGYQFRYAPENVRVAGTPAPKAAIVENTETTTINQPTTTEPMAKKKEDAPKAAKAPKETAAPVSTGDHKAIVALNCKKHQRIFLLLDAGASKEEIMKLAGCNAGEISNAKKMYAESIEKTATAKALLA